MIYTLIPNNNIYYNTLVDKTFIYISKIRGLMDPSSFGFVNVNIG
jgi:hypothetical protein